MGALRILLGMALVVVGAAKLLTNATSVLLPGEWMILVATLEAVAGVYLILRPSYVVCWFVLALACGGLAISVLGSGGADGCGCLGSVVKMSRWEHAMMAASFGMVASLVAGAQPSSRAPVAVAANEQPVL